MLKYKDLMEMTSGMIFKRGIATDDEKGINMLGTGRPIRWIAVRGMIHDWAIYCASEAFNEDYVRDYGDKVHDTETIRRLVKCTDKAFGMYRH